MQIFANCCEQNRLDQSRYELCYSQRVIDLRQTVGLTGIPNNSSLAIRPITKSRDQTVTVCVQLDGGEREVGEFRNDQSLWEIIGTLFPERVLDTENLEISCLYMRTEVISLAKCSNSTD